MGLLSRPKQMCMGKTEGDVTALLKSIRAGDVDSLDQLYSLVYKELHGLARKVRLGRRNDTVNTTALVHEAYLKLAGHGDWESRLHFMRTAAKAMRQILIGQARQKIAQKRGGDALDITFEEGFYEDPVSAEEVIALDEAISQLEQLDPRLAQVVECRYYAGLTVQETAELLGVSDRTVKRDWRTARAFLADAMKG